MDINWLGCAGKNHVERMVIEDAIKFIFLASSNLVEYEALVQGI